MNVPPAFSYNGFSFHCTAMMVPLPPPVPVPTANCCSSPMVSPAEFTIATFITPSVSVSTFKFVGMRL